MTGAVAVNRGSTSCQFRCREFSKDLMKGFEGMQKAESCRAFDLTVGREHRRQHPAGSVASASRRLRANRRCEIGWFSCSWLNIPAMPQQPVRTGVTDMCFDRQFHLSRTTHVHFTGAEAILHIVFECRSEKGLRKLGAPRVGRRLNP